MPILRDFERRLGGLVEGLFSKTFRSGLQPVELAKRILKEQEAGKTVGVSGLWAPNAFAFRLSPEDLGRFEQMLAPLAAELGQVVKDNAAERGWGLVGPPEVTFEADESLRRGDLACTAALVEGEAPPEPPPAAGALVAVHEQSGVRTVPVIKEVTTIGRLPDCDVVLEDPGASRRHAQIRAQGGGYTITDLGSTNGTRLNGATVQSRDLADGDRITIGTTLLEFRRP